MEAIPEEDYGVRFADNQAYSSLKDATRALTAIFTAARIPLSLPSETRRMLQTFVDENDGEFKPDESERVQLELKSFYEKYIAEQYLKYGAFMGVLRELRPALTRDAHILEWWDLIVKPIVGGTVYKKYAMEDAQEFLLGVMVYEEENTDGAESRVSGRLCKTLLAMYLDRTKPIDDEQSLTARENSQIAQQIESILVAFGRKKPRNFFYAVDDLVVKRNTRLQALGLLSSFLRHSTPHLYLVIHTPLVEHLLKCLMNDTSTTVLSVALTSLIMIMPHIPGSLAPHLPRLFLVYSRILCWEKFSPLSTQDQRNLVTDDRINPSSDTERDYGDVGIDATWEKVRPPPGSVEALTPELMTYFTYLYGLYPLNFVSYVRKPKKYLKSTNFPGADDFDLDQAVIRSRTEQFRQVHLMHPNFYHLSIDEELEDPKWSKMDPADVVAECHGLCVVSRPKLETPPGPPPSSKLPDVPSIPPLAGNAASPIISRASSVSGSSWRNTQSTAVGPNTIGGDSPVLRPFGAQLENQETLRPRSKASQGTINTCTTPNLDEFPRPGTGLTRNVTEKPTDPALQTSVAWLQHEVTLLRNDLNFERWHKAQYSTHIGHLQRRNNKDASVEAETLNLINANRALKQKLADAQSARETTLRDIQLGKKQASKYEIQLVQQLKDLKAGQRSWNADASELQRLRDEIKHYRDLLLAAEARELNKSHEVEIMQRDLDQVNNLHAKVTDLQRKLRDFERRQFEFESVQHEAELLQNEKETLELKLRSREQERDRMKNAHNDRVAELESQINAADAFYPRRPSNQAPLDVQSMIQSAVGESQTKLMQLKKAHGRLLERYTELEMEYQDVKSQLADLQMQTYGRSYMNDGLTSRAIGALDSGSSDYHDNESFVHPRSETAYTSASPTEESAARRFHQPFLRSVTSSAGLLSSSHSDNGTYQNNAGLTWKPSVSVPSPNAVRETSVVSRSSSQVPSTFNQTAPLSNDEALRQEGAFSVRGDEIEEKMRKVEKIQPKSEVRVYGRGGAQNIKLKTKDKNDKADKPPKMGGFRGLKGIK